MRRLTWLGLAALLLLAGCQSTRFPYATKDDDSINGVSIFLGMLADWEYEVEFERFLPEDCDADVVICFDPWRLGLSPEGFETMMSYTEGGETPRLAIYVLPAYLNDRQFWRDQAATFPERAESLDLQRLLAEQPEFVGRGLSLHPGQRTDTFDSSMSWLRDLQGRRWDDIPKGRQWFFDGDHVELLTIGTAPHAVYYPNPYEDGVREGVLLFTHPFLFMNYATVHQQNRQILDRLIRGFPRGDKVLVVEFPSTPSQMEAENRSIFSFLGVYPLNWVIWHFLLALALFFMCRWPIVGYPQQRVNGGETSFGEHISAYGRLLQVTGDYRFALDLIRRMRSDSTTNEEPSSLEEALSAARRLW